MEPMQPPEPTLPPRSTPLQPGGGPGWASPPTRPPGMPGAPGAPSWVTPPSPYGGMLPPASRTHGLATAALVCGLVGLVTFWLLGILPLLGFIFGLVSARAIKRSGGTLTGLGKARAGWITGLIGIVGAALLYWAVGTGRIDSDDDSAPFSSADVGDCVDSVPEGIVYDLDFISCNEPHGAEVFSIGDLNPDHDRPHPGDVAVFTEIETACLADFEPYVGLPYEESVFELFYIYPRSVGWKLDGSYVCFVLEVDKKTVGSAFQSDR